ncbi:hypothetical protein MRX96_007838 [Rhipicephalus microplus]
MPPFRAGPSASDGSLSQRQQAVRGCSPKSLPVNHSGGVFVEGARRLFKVGFLRSKGRPMCAVTSRGELALAYVHFMKGRPERKTSGGKNISTRRVAPQLSEGADKACA